MNPIFHINTDFIYSNSYAFSPSFNNVIGNQSIVSESWFSTDLLIAVRTKGRINLLYKK